MSSKPWKWMQRNTHPFIFEWNNVKISSRTAKVGGGGIRKEARERGKEDLEEGEKRDGNNYQKHVCRYSPGIFILWRRKKKSLLSPPLPPSVSFLHPQLNTALVCTSMQSTSHYLQKQLLTERKREGENTGRKEWWEGQRGWKPYLQAVPMWREKIGPHKY